MKSKLMTVAGAALFTLALEASASATTYDVSGSWFFPADSFSGTIDVSGSTVSDPNINLSGSGIPAGVDLTNLFSSFNAGAFYGATVDDGTAPGDYILSFDFTLPNAKNSEQGLLGFATLSEIFAVKVCYGDTCTTKDVLRILAGGGYGTVTPFSSSSTSDPAPTPLPPTLALFAGGLVMLGLFGWRRSKRVGFITAA